MSLEEWIGHFVLLVKMAQSPIKRRSQEDFLQRAETRGAKNYALKGAIVCAEGASEKFSIFSLILIITASLPTQFQVRTVYARYIFRLNAA